MDLIAAIRYVSAAMALEWPAVTSAESLSHDLELMALDLDIVAELEVSSPVVRYRVLFELAERICTEHTREFRTFQPDRKVLPTSHVRQMLLGLTDETEDFRAAVMKIAPPYRKILTVQYWESHLRDLPSPVDLIEAEIALVVQINQLGGYLADRTVKGNTNGNRSLQA